MKKIVYRLKNCVQDFKINFKTKRKVYKEKPKSRRKSFVIVFAAAVNIFGLTLCGPALATVAKEISKGNSKFPAIASAPNIPASKEVINTSLSGFAVSVFGLAVTSSLFAVGLACGFIVVIGILHRQGK